MSGYVHLLRCVGKAAGRNGGKALCNLLPFGEVLYEIARDAYEAYCRESSEVQLRAELEQLAQASQAELTQATDEVTAGEPAESRETLTSYLSQLPSSIRRSLRRPSDPSGTTIPASLPLKRPEDLLPFLPIGLPRFKAGDRPLAADWELVELLGRGGFGEIWKARHVHQSRKKPVALKFCLDPVAAATLRNEARLHDLLDRVREEAASPGIVPLLETYLASDPPCLMYEFIEGGDLGGFVQEMLGQGQLTSDVARRIVHRLASIVAAAHSLSPPIVHRDLKMSNALVRRGKEELPDLFVADFGIGGLAAGQVLKEQVCRATASRMLPTALRGAYTPLYASPQQMQGELPDPRDDVHALGVLWYQLATGHLGLMSIPPDWREVAEERGLGGEELQLLASCISSRADKRPGDACELARRLEEMQCPPSVVAPLSPNKKNDESGACTTVQTPPSQDQEDQQPDEGSPEDNCDNFVVLAGVAGVVIGVLIGAVALGLAGALIGGLPGLILGVPLGYCLRWCSHVADGSIRKLLWGSLLGALAGAGAGWTVEERLAILVGGLIGGMSTWCGILMIFWRKQQRKALGTALARKGRDLASRGQEGDAIRIYREAVKYHPSHAGALISLAWLLIRTKDDAPHASGQPLDYALRACRLPAVRSRGCIRVLASFLTILDQVGDSTMLERALESNPMAATTLNNLAWLNATSPVKKFRNGRRAVRLATRACELTKWEESHIVDTLAAAHAEAGQFDLAITRQQQARNLASKEKQGDYESRLKLYEQGLPYRTLPQSQAPSSEGLLGPQRGSMAPDARTR